MRPAAINFSSLTTFFPLRFGSKPAFSRTFAQLLSSGTSDNATDSSLFYPYIVRKRK